MLFRYTTWLRSSSWDQPNLAGIGMQSVADWAARQQANIQKKKDAQDAKMDTLKTGFDMLRVQQKLQKDLETATTDEERKAIEDKLEATISSTTFDLLISLLRN